jgi:thymidylate synthase
MSLIQFSGDTAAELYSEGLHHFRISGRKEHTRNGPAIVMPGPAFFTLNNPMMRVLDDHVRNANPFFHMMEFIWMMSGSRDVSWLLQFNKTMNNYADDKQLMASYGHRWRVTWGDQIKKVIQVLQQDPTSRQAVLQMWDPRQDLYERYKDKACNVSLLFRNLNGALDMLVVNRSNDFVWGALGANICHLTMLHELVAYFSGIPLGAYSVISNNLHIYTEMPNYLEISRTLNASEVYQHCEPRPMFQEGDTYEGFVADCEAFVNGHSHAMNTNFMGNTATFVFQAWDQRKVDPLLSAHELDNIEHLDWRIACQNYLKRKTLSSAISTEPSP